MSKINWTAHAGILEGDSSSGNKYVITWEYQTGEHKNFSVYVNGHKVVDGYSEEDGDPFKNLQEAKNFCQSMEDDVPSNEWIKWGPGKEKNVAFEGIGKKTGAKYFIELNSILESYKLLAVANDWDYSEDHFKSKKEALDEADKLEKQHSQKSDSVIVWNDFNYPMGGNPSNIFSIGVGKYTGWTYTITHPDTQVYMLSVSSKVHLPHVSFTTPDFAKKIAEEKETPFHIASKAILWEEMSWGARGNGKESELHYEVVKQKSDSFEVSIWDGDYLGNHEVHTSFVKFLDEGIAECEKYEQGYVHGWPKEESKGPSESMIEWEDPKDAHFTSEALESLLSYGKVVSIGVGIKSDSVYVVFKSTNKVKTTYFSRGFYPNGDLIQSFSNLAVGSLAEAKDLCEVAENPKYVPF